MPFRNRTRPAARRTSPLTRHASRLAATLLVAVLSVAAGAAAPAMAADAALTVAKVVDGVEAVTKAPGDEFTYTITVGCDDTDCVDAVLVDEVPAAFEGFQILGSSIRPSSQPATFSLVGCETEVSADCVATAAFEQPLDGGGVGIRAGDTYQITLTLKAPQDLAPDWSFNGEPVVNTATATAATADPAQDSASVTVVIDRSVEVDIRKSWGPDAQQFQPGVESGVELAVRNTSNVAAESIVVQDPAKADAGAAELDASNPFRIVDFVGIGEVTPPQGADLVTVDAYVYAAGSWNWVAGSPVAVEDADLPDGIAAADVAGVRFTYTSSEGATLAPAGAAGTAQLVVAQRAADRTTGETLVLGASATNRVAATVSVPGEAPVTREAEAPYRIGGLDVKVDATKSITPARIPAGTHATATIGAKNASNGPLTELTLSDLDYFTEDLTFGGFSAPLSYPAGATAGTIAWHFSDDSTVDAGFAAGDTPTAPAAPGSAHLTGFELIFTGAVESGAVVNAAFTIASDAGLVDEATGRLDLPNTLTVSAVNPAGEADDEASAPLAVFHPSIRLAIDKRISPSQAVAAGGTAVVQLPTTTSTDSAYVKPTEIVIEDVWRESEADDFWNAYNPVAIAPTQVLAGSTLVVEALTADGWQQIVAVPAGPTSVFSGSIAELAPTLDPAGITGLRYTFASAEGFAAGITVSPATVFQARATTRDGNQPTAVAGEPAATYENLAGATGQGAVAGGTVVTSDEVTDVAPARIIAYPGGDGGLMASKSWSPDTLSSQSGQLATSRLGWGVTSTGFESVVIADPNGGEGTPATTIFQAFDLIEVKASNDSRWQWDRVDAVELYVDGAWHAVTAPGGSWMNGAAFKGYALTADEQARATGVRIQVVPNDAARAASNDPLRPQPGSGVTTSPDGQIRTFDLVWKLRNAVRVPGAEGPWASATHGYNDPDPATIWNTVGVSGVQHGTPTGPLGASDQISLIDQPPAVSVTKSVDREDVPIPVEGEVAPEGYPQAVYTVTAVNDSASRASYLRVTDPMPCTDATVESCTSDADDWAADAFAGADYDPATNPFELVDLTKLTFSIPAGAGVDPAASTVTLWTRGAEGALATRDVSVAQAAALSPAELADVVGVSVRYQGTDPASTGGTIATGAKLTMTMTTKLRVRERSEPATPVTAGPVPNAVFAQGYDPVLAPESTPYDTAAAGFQLVDGVLDVTAEKTITPATLLEKDRANPVSVRLAAGDGDATVATEQVVIEDADADFWDRFALVSLDGVEVPAGADRVRVDVQRDGSDEWLAGTAAATAALPDVPVESVTGIRFIFDRADGSVFSHTAPPAGWLATANLTVRLLDVVRSTGDAIPFPSTIDNAITTESSRADTDVYEPATAEASDDLALQTGTYRVDVAKSPLDNVHTVEAATAVPWTLTFANTGSGYLTIDDVVDSLPAQLQPDFSVEPRYATSADGRLSTDVAFAFDQAANTVTFSWPEGGRRMAPGERFTITLDLVLQPGLSQGQRATNAFVVTTGQNLAACTNTSGNGQGVIAGTAATECGTTNYVEPFPGASLATFKGVKGEIDGDLVEGAVNTVTAGGPCLTDAEGYYRSPCAANTVIGATDAWKLEVVNSGTEPYRALTLVEPLPAAGDRMLATGGTRASTYRPVFDGAAGMDLSLPAGTTASWQVTTDPATCFPGGTAEWPTDPTCASAGWIDSTAFTGDWSEVRGVRILLDFTTTAAGRLNPGEGVIARFLTVNAPATADDPDLAPVDVPVTDALAWNQFGAQATMTDGSSLRRAPVKAGVTLVGGPIEVRKTVAGDAAEYAADEFLVDVSCTAAGAALDLGADATLELSAQNGFAARVEGIPLGADCTVTEQGDVGEFGETSRTGTPATVQVLQRADASGEVPATQTATITNTYEFGALEVAKAIDTAATVGSFGPFEFTLQCVSAIGEDVTLDAADRTFTLEAGATHRVADDTIPVGAECELAETDADGASAVSFDGDLVTDQGDGTALITVGAEAKVTATNRYEAGTLSVLKTLIGDGAAEYGEGPFTAQVSCSYAGVEVFRADALPIVPDEPTLVDAVFPAGTVCEVSEVLTGGATEHENPPAVVIAGPTAGEPVGAVTAMVTNDFRTGELVIEKERVGDGVEEFGAGPFQAQVVCLWDRDGETLTVPLPDGGLVTLDEDNDYRAMLEGVLVGAECTVEETDAGLATAVTLTPADGVVQILDPTVVDEPATVVITNRFDIGQLAIEKTVDRSVVAVGDQVTYTITVRNTGQIGAADLTVTDRLPEGASLVSSAPEGRVDGRTLTWPIAELAAGATAEFTVTVTFSAEGETVNVATVTNPEGPWRPIDVAGACEADADAACAKVAVHSLASTGVEGITILLSATALLMIAGIALISMQRRRSRRH